MTTKAPTIVMLGDSLTAGYQLNEDEALPAVVERVLAARGVKIGLCPSTDPLIGAGLPPILQFLNNGVQFGDIGMSVDVTCQTSVDPFAAMRTIMNSGRIAKMNGASFEQIIFTPGDPDDHTNGLVMPSQMLELATVNGAHVLGLGAVTGTLTPGKRADLIMVRTDDINMLPVEESDAAFQLVQHGQVANVDTVMVDGKILKRAGKLVGVDPREVAAAAAASHRRLVAAAKAAAAA